ncbi:ATP synthase F1, gamma subunit [Firmicutes bacterium M10-2]|nr:ATP synthase F1, gamma subunit [Firmicutes bacterium M10-2]
MAQSRQDIQARIASVDSTKKITKAMQLVASSKLSKQRDAMERNREYAHSLKNLLTMIVNAAGKNDPYLKVNEGQPSFIFVITSDMGLCGGYNANVYRALLQDVKKEDHVVMIGSRGSQWAQSKGIQCSAKLIDLNEDTAYMDLAGQMQIAIDLFNEKKISKIQVLYTHYKNTLTFIPVLETIIPVRVEKEQEKKGHVDTIFEPSKEMMLSTIVPMAAKSVLYSLYLESKTSEQASRRMAMESATDNATELQEQLELAYNRIRQGAITQEITEIVGGANALAS